MSATRILLSFIQSVAMVGAINLAAAGYWWTAYVVAMVVVCFAWTEGHCRWGAR